MTEITGVVGRRGKSMQGGERGRGRREEGKEKEKQADAP